MAIRVKPIVMAVAVFAIASWTPALVAQRGDGAQAQGGQGGGRGRGAAPQTPAGPVPRLANGKPDLSGL